MFFSLIMGLIFILRTSLKALIKDSDEVTALFVVEVDGIGNDVQIGTLRGSGSGVIEGIEQTTSELNDESGLFALAEVEGSHGGIGGFGSRGESTGEDILSNVHSRIVVGRILETGDEGRGPRPDGITTRDDAPPGDLGA